MQMCRSSQIARKQQQHGAESPAWHVLAACKHLEVPGSQHTHQCLTQLLFGGLLLLQPLHQLFLRAGSILVAGDHGAASDLHVTAEQQLKIVLCSFPGDYMSLAGHSVMHCSPRLKARESL